MEQLKQLFGAWAGEPCTEILSLGGGGSSRRYFRLVGERSKVKVTAIGTIADDLRENEAFFAFSRHLFAKGMPVPELYAIGDDRRHYLQQDLGDQSLYGVLYEKKRQGGGFDAEMLQLYKQALADLDAIQKAGRDMDFSVGFPRPAFDRRAMLWDLNYFKYYYLKLAHIPFDEDRLQDDFEHFVDRLLQADCSYFMYRDFQGRNIMVGERLKVKGETNKNSHPSLPLTPSHSLSLHKLYYIDYQGGRRGAAQYDVASILYSAKSDLPEAIRNELLHYYADLHGDPQFLSHYWDYVLMRILQTLGAYGYRGLYERKPYFLESIPLAVANLRRLVEDHPALLADLPEMNKVVHVLGRKGVQEVQGVQDNTTAGTFVLNSLNSLNSLSTKSPLNSGTTELPTLTVTVSSFSFKQGLPEDRTGNGGGHIFDCRALPNPGRYAEYKAYTGKDRPVIEFLQREPAVDEFLSHAVAIVSQSVDKYLERHFSHLSVAFGCTGGQHRSVYCAERLAAEIQKRYPEVAVVLAHRENP